MSSSSLTLMAAGDLVRAVGDALGELTPIHATMASFECGHTATARAIERLYDRLLAIEELVRSIAGEARAALRARRARGRGRGGGAMIPPNEIRGRSGHHPGPTAIAARAPAI